MKHWAHVALALASALPAACGSSTTPSPPPLQISCPSAVSAQSTSGTAVNVTFPLATATGGTAPLTTSCTPASGQPFALGATAVSCLARDAKSQSAACAFTVTVTKTPQLSVTKFLAYGDSITAGVIATSCPAGGGVNCTATTLNPLFTPQGNELKALYPRIGEESSSAYPRQLQAMMGARYTGQSFTVTNLGAPGEFIAEGKARLPSALTASAPQVLLLQEGANDLNQGRPPISTLVNDLRSMVREARGRGIEVFLATTLPQRPNACRGYDFCDGVNDSSPLSAQIRTMAVAEGAVLVDLYPMFDGQTAALLGLDGLHPNDSGYRTMADAFLAAIKQRFEQ